jgi:hypothetical protein
MRARSTVLRKVRKLGALVRDIRIRRRRDIIMHPVGLRAPEVPYVIVPDILPTRHDIHIAERLLAAYRRSVAEENARGLTPPDDLWALLRTLQPTFFAALHQEDPSRLAAYLCNMSRHDATHGTVQGAVEYRKIRRRPRYRAFLALMAKDKLVSLAEAVGAITCENPEQGSWGRNLHLDLDLLVEETERVLGMDISPPPIDGGLLKICSSKALYNERDINAIFTAHSLCQIVDFRRNPSVCEIGAGSGRVVYWSHRMGVRAYTLLDLPHINVIQGFYLLKSLADTKITLYGEPGANEDGERIAILPYFCTADMRSPRFDLILNQDSFPEIHEETVRDYLSWIKQASRRFFLSINHESQPPSSGTTPQLNVSKMVEDAGGFTRASRAQYWLRRGYVSELYSVDFPASVSE